MPDRRLVTQLASFREDLVVTRWERGQDERWRPLERARIAEPISALEVDYRALVLGLRNYVDKNRFPGIVLGLSSGVDFCNLRRRGRPTRWGPSACMPS